MLAEFELAAHELELLRLACEALDRCEEARLVLADAGLFVSGRYGQTVAHPAVAIERDSRLAAARLFKELGLEAPAPVLDPMSLAARRKWAK